MNIKRAKEEIRNSIEAYLSRDEYGEYRIPPVRQRPLLLIGPPGIGKTQIMSRSRGKISWDLFPTPSRITPGRAQSGCRLSARRNLAAKLIP